MNTQNTTPLAGTAQATASTTATVDTRYSFVGQYLEASTIFVRRLQNIESSSDVTADETIRTEHRGLVCAVILQCAAALETESHEVCVYGPGAYLGSNGTDMEAQRFLAPMADVVDGQDTLFRFQLILHPLERRSLHTDREPYQSIALVIRLRNELVHYKSRWGAEMARNKLFTALEQLRHTPPPFTDQTMNFFPHRCLSAACAAWALHSVIAFLEAFYESLGVPSRLASYGTRLIP